MSTTYPCQCRFAAMAPLHHDMLLNIEHDVTMTVELLELATTWAELDYSGQTLIPPSDWMDFAAAHPWKDAELALRVFGLATDVAARHPQPAMAAWDHR